VRAVRCRPARSRFCPRVPPAVGYEAMFILSHVAKHRRWTPENYSNNDGRGWWCRHGISSHHRRGGPHVFARIDTYRQDRSSRSRPQFCRLTCPFPAVLPLKLLLTWRNICPVMRSLLSFGAPARSVVAVHVPLPRPHPNAIMYLPPLAPSPIRFENSLNHRAMRPSLRRWWAGV